MERVRAHGLEFACRVHDGEDETVLALHGFPDDAGTFDPLAERLDCRVVAPYMRGYRPSGVAPGGDYSARTLGRDALALAGAFDADHLVGHDWGAVAAYAAARADPGAFDRVVGMAVPPRFDALVWSYPRQFLRSWYVWTFQVPGAERLLSVRDHRLVELLWRAWSPGWAYDEDRLAAVRESIRGREREVLAYYRQFVRPVVARLPREGVPEVDGRIETPTLVLAGEEDRCIGSEAFERADDPLADGRVERVPGAGHFLHRECPDAVAEEVASFLAPGD